MLTKDASQQTVRALFRKSRVADLEALFGALDTRSRMSVFRRLREIGYLSSYTHTGRYYTLADIPEFDEHGLWRHEAIGFSRFGTLKATVVNRVERAEAGCMHVELEALLRVRVFSTLHRLIGASELGREMVGGTYLYVSTDDKRARRQLDTRQQQVDRETPRSPLPSDEVVLLVLVEALHASEGLPAAPIVASRLEERGEVVTAGQVEQIYAEFRLIPGKKTAERP
ncbi:MAG: hypothetical protein ABIE42_09305 [Candidatus Eisenbacteria bacterium]